MLQRSLKLDNMPQIQDSFRAEDPTDFTPYNQIAMVFKTNDAKQLEMTVANLAETLQKDKNLGLAKIVLQRLSQRKVRRLGEVYLTLGFKEIAGKTGVTEVEKFIF